MPPRLTTALGENTLLVRHFRGWKTGFSRPTAVASLAKWMGVESSPSASHCWATVCKTVPPTLSDRRPFCLSVTLVYCGQMVGWIKMPLGTELGLDLGHIVLEGNPAPPFQEDANFWGVNRRFQA